MKKLMRKKLALMLATLKKKRKYYCECEYLESTGTQYINTGYKPNTNTRTVGRVYFNSFVGSNADYVFGVFSSPNNYGLNVGSARQYFNVPWGSNAGINLIGLVPQTNKDYDFDISKTGYLINGQSYGTVSSESVNSARNMYLFWSNGTSASGMNGRIYYLKIYDNGALVRDFIPVLGWDGKGYMYDKVSDTLFGNAGTGDFVVGRQIHPVEYLESTGTQYIDTGLVPTANTNFELDADILLTSRPSAFQSIYGYWGGSSNGRFSIFATPSTTANGYMQFVFGTNAQNINFGSSFGRGLYKLKDGVFSYNGQELLTVTGSPVTASATNMYMFGANDTSSRDFVPQKVYMNKVWESTQLVRDYIPAIDENGVGFMFDRVTHTIYDNAGQGQFKYPDVELEFIKNNDTNTYLSLTGFYPTPDWDIECEAMGKTWGFTSSFNSLNIMGCGSSASTDSYTLSIAQGNVEATTPTCRRGGAGVRKTGCDLDVKYKIISTETSITWNGEAGTFLSQPTGNTAKTNPITLFRNPLSSARGTMNIYSFVVKSHQTGNKILDLVPILRNGSPGMIDKVNNVFYTGSGSFTAGKIIEKEYE